MSNARYLTEAVDIENRWAQTGFLEGLDNKWERSCTSVLLENQMLLLEKMTDTADIAQFKRISIPLVRRIFPQLIANKIVAIQPLLGPTGLVYYMRFRYSTNKGQTRGLSNNGGYPDDDKNTLGQLASGDANLDIYYSSNFVENEESSTDDGADTTSIYSPVEHVPVFPGTLTGVVFVGSTAIQYFQVKEDKTFLFTDIGTPSAKAVSSGSTVDPATGEIRLAWNSAPGENHLTISYEYNMECNSDIPELNLTLENEEVAAKPRKLKAVWSYESEQDLRSQMNLDLEEELTTALATEINLEIDREILRDLLRGAGTVSSWDYSTALGDTIKERYESLYVKLTELSAVVHRKTLRGSANWIVTSPEVASLFETATAGYAPITNDTFTTALGIQYVGTVSQRWKVFKDPLFKHNQILVGYKGDQAMDAGFFFCPYVPLIQTPTIPHPDDFCPRKGLVTRYGKKMLREGSKFYARLTISNFIAA